MCTYLYGACLQAQTALSGQVQELQDQLKESKSALLLEEDKLRELRKVERELTQHNADLTTKLSLAEVSWDLRNMHACIHAVLLTAWCECCFAAG